MLARVHEPPASESATPVTLFTDSHVVRGTLFSRARRLTDVLNAGQASFLVLQDVIFEDFGRHATIERSEYAQVNLASILFAVGPEAEAPTAALHTAKVPARALVSVPPFRIVGRIHLLPDLALREALTDLGGRFLPVTDATYWSEQLGEARTSVPFLAVNHDRAQLLAPYRESDVWTGLAPGAAGGSDWPARGAEGGEDRF